METKTSREINEENLSHLHFVMLCGLSYFKSENIELQLFFNITNQQFIDVCKIEIAEIREAIQNGNNTTPNPWKSRDIVNIEQLREHPLNDLHILLNDKFNEACKIYRYLTLQAFIGDELRDLDSSHKQHLERFYVFRQWKDFLINWAPQKNDEANDKTPSNKKHPGYFLQTFFDDEAQTTHEYKSYKRAIDEWGSFVMKTETDTTKVYTPELALIFGSSELPATERTTEKKTKINTIEFFNTYVKSFKEGEKFFDDTFNVAPNIIYGENAEQYIKDLHLNYYHIRHDGLHEGWQYVKKSYPIILTHDEISKFGYYSGIVSKVEEMIKKYPKQFQNFDKCEDSLRTDQIEDATIIEEQSENNLLVSTIDDWLEKFKGKMTDKDYSILVSALKEFFEKGKFPVIQTQIKVGRVNKKKFGWALNQIYRTEKTDSLPKEYLLFAKENISLFKDVKFDKINFTQCNLYKYFTTKTN